MKPLVLFYSSSGNNRYLAHRISRALKCDIEEIRPRLNLMPCLILFSLIGAGPGARALKHDVKGYDRLVLCGPIWMGTFISPLRDIVKKYRPDIKRLYFVTCCGGGDEKKDDKYGYTSVFSQVEKAFKKKRVHCEAFPIGLVVPDDKKKDDDAIMKTRLSDKNFTGKIQERLDSLVRKIKED